MLENNDTLLALLSLRLSFARASQLFRNNKTFYLPNSLTLSISFQERGGLPLYYKYQLEVVMVYSSSYLTRQWRQLIS